MTIKDLEKSFVCLNSSGTGRSISNIYCCDLASNTLGKIKPDSVWITVIPSENTIAAAVDADIPAVIISENNTPPQSVIQDAKKYGVSLFLSELPTYETALKIPL